MIEAYFAIHSNRLCRKRFIFFNLINISFTFANTVLTASIGPIPIIPHPLAPPMPVRANASLMTMLPRLS